MGQEQGKFRGTNPNIALNSFLDDVSDQSYDNFVAREDIKSFFESKGIEMPDDSIMARDALGDMNDSDKQELLELIS